MPDDLRQADAERPVMALGFVWDDARMRPREFVLTMRRHIDFVRVAGAGC